MELNNKKDLISLLAESEIQGFDAKAGTPEAYSVFEEIDANMQFKLFTDTHENVREWLNEQGGQFTISALELVRVAMRNLELNTTSQVLQFVWIMGIMYHEIRVKLQAMAKLKDEANRAVKEEGTRDEETSNMALAIGLDLEVSKIADLINQLPIYRGWKEAPEWEAEYAARLQAIKNLIKKLY